MELRMLLFRISYLFIRSMNDLASAMCNFFVNIKIIKIRGLSHNFYKVLRINYTEQQKITFLSLQNEINHFFLDIDN